MGQPGTALANLMRIPRFQIQASEKLAPAFLQAQKSAAGVGRAAPSFTDWLEQKREESKDKLATE